MEALEDHLDILPVGRTNDEDVIVEGVRRGRTREADGLIERHVAGRLARRHLTIGKAVHGDLHIRHVAIGGRFSHVGEVRLVRLYGAALAFARKATVGAHIEAVEGDVPVGACRTILFRHA